jgi:hypothetical protein
MPVMPVDAQGCAQMPVMPRMPVMPWVDAPVMPCDAQMPVDAL